MKKLQTPPEKKSPPLSQQLPSPLNIEILARPPSLKICYEAQPPSPLAERGGGAHYVYDVIHRLNKNLKTYCLISAEGKEGKMQKNCTKS